ncbi:dihydroneopterin aldolase [Salipiger pallidus]|uniref:Dihydroneopterin aldolase n=1 Tax=Salipiger pallidus TaxID=1775170 RepID=A0A8J2ZGA1_9RHOB|nr:disulfide bond formation protein B [Salipiger pallidus]GGG60536.1 dihydroneopterin aldolase [Salipiger pallidus]
MTLSRNILVALATAGSAAVLLGAFGFQYIGGLPPCHLCLWQRWPHAIAILIGALALAVPGRVLPVLGALAALATAAVGVYHTGVERKWWEGPTTCTASGDISTLSADDAINQIMGAAITRCDDVLWQFLGLSMASWNAIISVVLAGLWIAAARKSRA